MLVFSICLKSVGSDNVYYSAAGVFTTHGKL
jgi:hypothetical protein